MPVQPFIVGINHVTTITADLDPMVDFYTKMFGVQKVFERLAIDDDLRMAIIEVGGGRYVKVVEDPTGGVTKRSPAERFGLAVESISVLRALREHMAGAGAAVGEIERLPTQWVLAFVDPDGTTVQVCAPVLAGDASS